jgi:mono/diheme cytochrome c family protein
MGRLRVILLSVFLAPPARAAAQGTDSLPAGVTAALIIEGKTVFSGPGLCTACHGPDAKGVKGLGPNLTDSEWLHSNGAYQALVAQITSGVPADKSTTGVAMPPKGGGPLTDAQVRAVAAYVWSLSHRGGSR